MKILKTRPILFLFPLFSWGIVSGQDTPIDIYLAADINSRKVDSIFLDDTRLGQPTPVLDEAKAALGWHFADFTGEIEGYVPDAKIGKDLLPVDNTIIHAGPAEDSPVVAVHQYGDDLEIIDTGIWWKVRFSGSFPVYFVLDTPPPLPAVTAAAEPIAAPAPIIEAEPIEVEETEWVSTVPVQASQLDNPPPGVIGQRYEGTFKQSKKRFGLFKPKAAFYLEDASGDRIAWLDISDIVLPGSMKSFVDQEVIIHGERSRLKSDWLIHARNMRLK